MTDDQWFTFWMTLFQVVGSGLVTFGAVWLGLRHGRTQQKHADQLSVRMAEQETYRDDLRTKRAVLEEWDHMAGEMAYRMRSIVENGRDWERIQDYHLMVQTYREAEPSRS